VRYQIFLEENQKSNNQEKLKQMGGKFQRNPYDLKLDKDSIADIKKTEVEYVEAPRFFV
jgi:hypothetical protein